MYDSKRMARIIEIGDELSEAFPKLEFVIEEINPIRFGFEVAGVSLAVTCWLKGEAATDGGRQVTNDVEIWHGGGADCDGPVDAVDTAVLVRFGDYEESVFWLAGVLHREANRTWTLAREVFLEAESSTPRFPVGQLFYLTSRKTYYAVEVQTREGAEGIETRAGWAGPIPLPDLPLRLSRKDVPDEPPYTYVKVYLESPRAVVEEAGHGLFFEVEVGDEASFFYVTMTGAVFAVDIIASAATGVQAIYDGPLEELPTGATPSEYLNTEVGLDAFRMKLDAMSSFIHFQRTALTLAEVRQFAGDEIEKVLGDGAFLVPEDSDFFLHTYADGRLEIWHDGGHQPIWDMKTVGVRAND